MEKEITPKKIEGVISKKEGNTRNGPKGYFYLDGNSKKFTCWSQTYFDNFDEGDEVIITYLENPNTYNGKEYINNNIRFMKFKDSGEIGFTDDEKEELDAVGINTKDLPAPRVKIKSENGKIKLNGLFYQVKEIELELITS